MEWNTSNKIIEIDGIHFSTLSEFYLEISKKFMKDSSWSVGSLDGLHDILFGGFGVFNPDENVEVVWKNSEKSRNDLGFEATKMWLENKLKIGKPYNTKLISHQLQDLENGERTTLFKIILEIFAEHKNIHLVLK